MGQHVSWGDREFVQALGALTALANIDSTKHGGSPCEAWHEADRIRVTDVAVPHTPAKWSSYATVRWFSSTGCDGHCDKQPSKERYCACIRLLLDGCHVVKVGMKWDQTATHVHELAAKDELAGT